MAHFDIETGSMVADGPQDDAYINQLQEGQKQQAIAAQKSQFTRENGYLAWTPEQMQQWRSAPSAAEKNALATKFQQDAGWGYDHTDARDTYNTEGLSLAEGAALGSPNLGDYTVYDPGGEAGNADPHYRGLTSAEAAARTGREAAYDTWHARGMTIGADGNYYFNSQLNPTAQEYGSDFDEAMQSGSQGAVGGALMIGAGSALGALGGVEAGAGTTGIDSSTGLFAGESATSGAAGAETGASTGALTQAGTVGDSALTGSAGQDTLGGNTMDLGDLNFDDFGFDPGGEGLSNAPVDPGGGGAFDTGGSQGVFDSQGNPIATSTDGGAFDMGGSQGVFDAQGNPIANSGNFLQQLATKYGAQALGFAQKMLAGDPEAMKKLLSLGVPAAAIAGLFENNKSPLVGSQVNASRGALAGADKFAALPAIGTTPSQQRAIETANADAGNWKPYFDKAGALADTGAGGITPETTNKYLNPELQGVLDPTIRDLTEAADARRQKLRAEVAMSGNDFYGPGTEPTRFNVSDSLLDRELFRGISDATGKIRSQAWTDATTLAGKDLDRNLTASNLYGGLGKSAGALGSVDFQNLAGAGALERQPAEDARTHAADTSKLYTGVVSGINPAVAGSTPQSTLSKTTGALGALSTAKDIGLY